MQLEILSIFGIPWVAACMAVFVWWFLTGLLLFIVKKIDQINESAHLHTLIISLQIQRKFLYMSY